MPTKTIAIIQARMGSTRFPGKMMESLNGTPLIEWVVRRTMSARLTDLTILATSDLPRDDVLADAATQCGAEVFRGDEEDVLGRFAAAALKYDAGTIIRICADRPLVDPSTIDDAIRFFNKAEPVLSFNHISEGGQNWPRGFGAEVLSAERLHWLNRNVSDPRLREHVTLYLWENRKTFNIVPVPCPAELDPGYADALFDVDWPEDLVFLQQIMAGMTMASNARDIVAKGIEFGLETRTAKETVANTN